LTVDTKTRLLQAAEKILIEQGVHALTVRRVGEVSDLNPTLITYHFGSVGALLDQLMERNLAPMLAAWEAIDSLAPAGADAVAQVLRAWLEPLLAPAAFNPGGRALIVLDEIASHGQQEVRERMMRDMVRVADQVADLLAPQRPALDLREVRVRLRYIAGAALGPPPRTRLKDGSERRRDPATDSDALVRFAVAALSG